MPTTKKAKTKRTVTTKKSAKPAAAKNTKKAKAPASAPIDWSHAIAKAAQQKRTQASWPGTGESWKKKARI